MDSAIDFLIELFGKSIATINGLEVVACISILDIIIAVIVILMVIGLVFSAKGGSK